MKIINTIDFNIEDKAAVALGNFDGIHVGHQFVLKRAVEMAKAKGIKSVCYTFANHPYNYIRNIGESDPEGIKLICTEAQKIKMLEEMGFDILVNIPFDNITMVMPANHFIEEILVKRTNAAVICVGFNYTFGAKAAGNSELLIAKGEQFGVEVYVHDPVIVDGEVVSSSLIRQKLAEGDMLAANKLLGRDYCFSGVVEHGNNVGAKLGFPTANLPAPINRAMPPNGVYFGHVVLDGISYNCLTNIGFKPTVTNAEHKNIESYIFDYEGSCYGKIIDVYFEKFLRPEIKFANTNELHDQIAKDCEAAKTYFYK